MSIYSLLGFGTNWDRVNKNQLINSMVRVGTVVYFIFGALHRYDYDMEKFFVKFEREFTKEWAYKVIISFGPMCPTRTEYSKFKDFVSTSHLLPSAKELKKHPEYQDDWEIAYQWAKEYGKAKTEPNLERKIDINKELEEQIKSMDIKLKVYEKKLDALKTQHKHELLLKDQKISKLNETLAKKKWKLNRSKLKKDYKSFKKENFDNEKIDK